MPDTGRWCPARDPEGAVRRRTARRAALCPGPPGDTRPVDHSVGRACPWHGRAGAPARTRVSILRTTVTAGVGAAVNPETVAVPTF